MSEKTTSTKTNTATIEKPSPTPKGAGISQGTRSPWDQMLFLQQTIGNQRVRKLLHSGKIQPKLKINTSDDAYEQEADLIAERIMRMPDPSMQRKPGCTTCPDLIDEESGASVHRKSSAAHAASPLSRTDNARIESLKNGGGPLPEATRSYFEPRFNHDFGSVRVRMDAHAAEAARSIHAKAFTFGDTIAFNTGEFAPETREGRELIAHELTHVLQQSQAVGIIPEIQRNGEEVCEEKPPEEQVCEEGRPEPEISSTAVSQAPPPPLTEDVEEFKRMVLSIAKVRLANNRGNLAGWATLVGEIMSAVEVEAQVLATEAETLHENDLTGRYELWAGEENPAMRYVYEQQMRGHYLACTGCHATLQAQDYAATHLHVGPEWTAPADRLTNLADQVRPQDRPTIEAWSGESANTGGTSCASCHTSGTTGTVPSSLFNRPRRLARRYPVTPGPFLPTNQPNTQAVLDAIQRIQPIVRQLGPDGYQVLPSGVFSVNSSMQGRELRAYILDHIAERRQDYADLMQMIEDGEVGYEHFGPIIRDYLPLASKEVQEAIRDEMDSNAFWGLVEGILVGIATVAALLLTIFPPTTVLGVTALGLLEVGLGAYAVAKAPEMISIGEAYMLGTGADNVFTREQQDAGAMMVFSGFLNLVTGPLMMYSGLARLSAIPIPPTALPNRGGTPLLLPAGPRVVQSGEFVVTINADGSAVATVAGRPDLLIVVRNGEMTMYQTLAGGGGTRIVASAPVPASALPGTTSSAMVPYTGTSSTTAMVPYTGTSSIVPYSPPGLVPVSPAGAQVIDTVGAGATGSRILITPAPRVPLQLTSGAETTYTLRQIQNMHQPDKWQQAEIYFRQLYRDVGQQQHLPVPGTGGRYPDVWPDPSGGFQMSGEVKAYQRWITVEGTPTQNMVPLSTRIEEQIAKDVWLRDHVPGYDPHWIFADAPPSPDLIARLNAERILYIIYHR